MSTTRTAIIVLALTTSLCSAATQRTFAEINAEQSAWSDYFTRRGYSDSNHPPDSLFQKFKVEYAAKLKAAADAAEKLKAAQDAAETFRASQAAAKLKAEQEAAAKTKATQASKSLPVSIQGANRYDSFQCWAGVWPTNYSINWTYSYYVGCNSIPTFGGASGETMYIPRSVFSLARGPVSIMVTVKDKDGRTGTATMSRTGPLN
jgi:hypothetical protein